jgi:hypothetical protein
MSNDSCCGQRISNYFLAYTDAKNKANKESKVYIISHQNTVHEYTSDTKPEYIKEFILPDTKA